LIFTNGHLFTNRTMHPSTNDNKAKILAFTAVFFWSTVATAFKIGLKNLSPSYFLLFVILTSVIFLTLIITIKQQWKSFKIIPLNEWIKAILGGLINPFAYYLILFEAYHRLPAQIAQALNYSWVIVLVLLSAYIYKQKLSKNVILGLVLGFTGVIFVITRGEFYFQWFDGLGVFLALFSSILWASYWILSKSSTVDSIKLLFINQIVGLLATFIYLLILGKNLFLPVKSSLLAAIYTGLFEMGATFLLWLTAMKLATRAEKISHLIFLSPIISLFFIRIFLSEPIFFSTFVGLLLILLGIFTIEKGPVIINHLKTIFKN